MMKIVSLHVFQITDEDVAQEVRRMDEEDRRNCEFLGTQVVFSTIKVLCKTFCLGD